MTAAAVRRDVLKIELAISQGAKNEWADVQTTAANPAHMKLKDRYPMPVGWHRLQERSASRGCRRTPFEIRSEPEDGSVQSTPTPALAWRLGAVGVFPGLIPRRADRQRCRGSAATVMVPGARSSPSNTRVPNSGSPFQISSPGAVSCRARAGEPGEEGEDGHSGASVGIGSVRTASGSAQACREGWWDRRETARRWPSSLRPAGRWHPDKLDAPPAAVGRDPGEGQGAAQDDGHTGRCTRPYDHSPNAQGDRSASGCVVLLVSRWPRWVHCDCTQIVPISFSWSHCAPDLGRPLSNSRPVRLSSFSLVCGVTVLYRALLSHRALQLYRSASVVQRVFGWMGEGCGDVDDPRWRPRAYSRELFAGVLILFVGACTANSDRPNESSRPTTAVDPTDGALVSILNIGSGTATEPPSPSAATGPRGATAWSRWFRTGRWIGPRHTGVDTTVATQVPPREQRPGSWRSAIPGGPYARSHRPDNREDALVLAEDREAGNGDLDRRANPVHPTPSTSSVNTDRCLTDVGAGEAQRPRPCGTDDGARRWSISGRAGRWRPAPDRGGIRPAAGFWRQPAYALMLSVWCRVVPSPVSGCGGDPDSPARSQALIPRVGATRLRPDIVATARTGSRGKRGERSPVDRLRGRRR